MLKINWEPKGSDKYARAQVGCITMCCRLQFTTDKLKYKWYADVFMKGNVMTMRVGPIRYSLPKAKEDCIRLARELLLDYRAGLKIEMKNFDL
jgi:hypothetical protein